MNNARSLFQSAGGGALSAAWRAASKHNDTRTKACTESSVLGRNQCMISNVADLQCPDDG
jgi:hypothetical protein